MRNIIIKFIINKLYMDYNDESSTQTINGEYWFDDSGFAIYADGDIGDINHEGHVIQQCCGEIASEFDLFIDEPNMEDLEKELFEIIAEDETFLKSHSLTSDEVMDSDNPKLLLSKYLAYKTSKSLDYATELVDCAYGYGDAREYAIKNWNWARVHGNSIEVNRLDIDTLKTIARGIENALNDEGIEGGEEGEYEISTYTGKRYTITLSDMLNGNISGLERNDIENSNSAAKEQLRKMDMDSMPAYYKDRGLMGDSFLTPKFDLLLKEGFAIVNLRKKRISEMAYPDNFSHSELVNNNSYKKKLAYAQTHLKKISSGSSRVVFQIDNEKVLKIAKNDKGLAQNSVESDWGLQNYPIIARVFDTSDEFKDIGPVWLEMELAKKITQKRFIELTGITLSDLNSLLQRRFGSLQFNRPLDDRLKKILNENEFYYEIEHVISDYDFPYGDYGKINSYGEVLRDGKPTIVLIDFGWSHFVKDNFYFKK